MWGPFEHGSTVGQPSYAGGLIVRDEYDEDAPARVTLVRTDIESAPWVVHVDAWCFHYLRFIKLETEVRFEDMLDGLEELFIATRSRGEFSEALRSFMARFPSSAIGGPGVWRPFRYGATLGEFGYGHGVIVRDEDCVDGGVRVTLERTNTEPATWVVTVYGLFFYCRSVRLESELEFEAMLESLWGILIAFHTKTRDLPEAIRSFKDRFPSAVPEEAQGWQKHKNGATIGKKVSDGVIVRDEKHNAGARAILMRTGSDLTPWKVECSADLCCFVYTRYMTSEVDFQAMLDGLQKMLIASHARNSVGSEVMNWFRNRFPCTSHRTRHGK